MPAREAACAIDFGTSNSAIAVLGSAAGTRLVELEPGARTMPTAVFYITLGVTIERLTCLSYLPSVTPVEPRSTPGSLSKTR
jgi:molecular chaperone DnaK (HSP70)